MKLLSLSMALFVLSVGVLFVTKYEQKAQIVPKTIEAEVPISTTSPHIVSSAPELSANSVYIYDVEAQSVLYSKNPELQVPPASTTKMMTALVAISVYDPDSVVTIPYYKVDGEKIGLYAGEKISIESLLYGTLVSSGNDAAEALARVYPDGRDAFVALMNLKAHQLGMNSTQFENPTGLDEDGHVSSAHDMALLGLAVMATDGLKEIVGTTKASIASSDGKFVHRLLSTNTLLSTVPGVLGVKTGWTEAAHENLVTYITRDNHTIVISLFGSDDRFGETKKLIDWVYGNAVW